MWGEGRALPLSAALIVAAALCTGIFLMLRVPSVEPHSTCMETKSQLEYFPAASPESAVRLDAFDRDWYSKYLRAMHEPSLACETRQPVYRFLWLRSFEDPIVVRIEKRGDGMFLAAVRLGIARDGGFGEEVARIERALSRREIDAIDRTLADARIWDAPDIQRLTGLDGAQWIVEARDGKRYRLHKAWSPARGRVHDLGMAFIAATGWSIPANEIY